MIRSENEIWDEARRLAVIAQDNIFKGESAIAEALEQAQAKALEESRAIKDYLDGRFYASEGERPAHLPQDKPTTFDTDLKFSHYEDDVPIFVKKDQ